MQMNLPSSCIVLPVAKIPRTKINHIAFFFQQMSDFSKVGVPHHCNRIEPTYQDGLIFEGTYVKGEIQRVVIDLEGFNFEMGAEYLSFLLVKGL